MKGPWPTPAADRLEPVAVTYANRYPQWGSRTIATVMRLDGIEAPDSTVYRVVKRAGSVLEVGYQAQRRQRAQARRAAFVVPPPGPNQVWQFDFTEFETRHGGIWQIDAVTDYWSKLELGYHVTTIQNHGDVIETFEQAIREAERLLGQPLADWLVDELTGEIRPVAVVTDTGRASNPRASPRSSSGGRS